eukprot:TRINITY_DN36373_c0_g1_i1.p1 TRINITY_DN36373_c0_g1~~TRINITY_DN36373_c0_g1_i1.p1  ORF type:complete len:322 (+),score=58.07 TRINITY_DN36373_c0_g1_i1:141-1106(+)
MGAAAPVGQLPERGDPNAVLTCLKELPHNTDFAARAKAAEALGIVGTLGDRMVISALVQSLREDPSADVRAKAAKSLGTVASGAQSRSAVEALSQALDVDRDARVRKAVATSLGKVTPRGLERAVGALLRSLQRDSSAPVRCRACEALGSVVTTGDVHAVDVLIARLEDETDATCLTHACLALGDAALPGDPRASAALQRCSNREHGDKAAYAGALAEALRKLDPALGNTSPKAASGKLGPAARKVDAVGDDIILHAFRSHIGKHGTINRYLLEEVVLRLMQMDEAKESASRSALTLRLDAMADARDNSVDVRRFVKWLAV